MSKSEVAQIENDSQSESRIRAAMPSARFRKSAAVGGDQGDDARNLQECRNKLELTADHLVIACDQLGEAIAAAQQRDDDDSLMMLLPTLQTLWQLRWELFVSAGEVSAEPAMRREVACYPEAESEAAE